MTSGERNERTALPELMSQGAFKRSGPGRPKLHPRTVVGDRGYTGKPSRDYLRRRGISVVIPQLTTKRTARLMDRVLYRERNVVERLVGRLKEFRHIATRYEKLAAGYPAFASSPLRTRSRLIARTRCTAAIAPSMVSTIAPLTPSSMTSGTEPLRQAITGVPADIASIMTRPKGPGQSIGNNRARALPRKLALLRSSTSPTNSISGCARSGRIASSK